MTGFGQGEANSENFQVLVEVKTVNNRFKDIRFRMSNLFNSQERDLKKKIETRFKRGSFDVAVTYKKSTTHDDEFNLDEKKVKNFIEKIQSLTPENVTLSLNPTEFLRSDFSLQEDEEKKEVLSKLLLKAFEIALDELEKSRAKEGEGLLQTLKVHLNEYQEKLAQVASLREKYPEMIKDKLVRKLTEKLEGINIDEGRVLQEVTYYLEKMVIDEEIDRANIHIGKMTKILDDTNQEQGRKLEFILQELNRETNTIGSKSSLIEISNCVVEMKLQLEKMREQSLNLE